MSSPKGSDITAQLWTMARRVLATERSYTQDHVKAKLETYFVVSPERAANGFRLMVEEGVLLATFGEGSRYYLSDSTPF